MAQLFSHRVFWILLIGAALTTVIFKKRLSELKGIAYVFVGLMISFVVLMFAELWAGSMNVDVTMDEIGAVKFDHHLITAISMIIFMYNI